MKKPTTPSKVIIAPNPPKPKQDSAQENPVVECPCEEPASAPKGKAEVEEEAEAEEE